MKAELFNKLNKQTLIDLGVYVVAIAIVVFSVNRATLDIENVGKRSIALTMNNYDAKQELTKMTAPGVKFDDFSRTAKLLISHGRIDEAKKVLNDRLKHVRTIKSETASLEEIGILRLLATCAIKAVKLNEARALLQDAAEISAQIGNYEQRAMISSELIDLYSQYALYSQTEEERKGAEEMFNHETEHLNAVITVHPLNSRQQRLLRNRHRAGLIEMNRFLELDNYEPEPGAHGGI